MVYCYMGIVLMRSIYLSLCVVHAVDLFALHCLSTSLPSFVETSKEVLTVCNSRCVGGAREGGKVEAA